MLDVKTLDELADRFMNSLPEGLKLMQADIKKQVRQAMLATFAKMDLVTREEFDIQTAVLARTRQKLETLEAQLAELESKIDAAKINAAE